MMNNLISINKASIPSTHKSDVEKAIFILNSYNCKEIYLFGSLVTGDYIETSDIDLGIKGFAKDKFFKMYCELQEALNHEIDLVDFDSQTDFFNLLTKIKELRKVA